MQAAEMQPTREDFAALLEESFATSDLAEGTVVKGTVIAIEKDVAVVDVGLKVEGRVPLKEFGVRGRDGELKPGDEVEVYLERVENALGEAMLSREKARREESWVRLEESFEKNETVTGQIFNQVKGGFTVDLDGAVAFLPRSQVDVRPVRDVGPLMNSPQPFRILKMDKRRGNIVVSRRSVLEDTLAEQRSELVQRLHEGQVVDGVVKNITEYGAFVDLGGIDGLLHVTDMAWRRVNHPSEILNIGETVKVQIVRINPETFRISLGMKQLEADPWEGIEAKYPIGARFTGRVTNITDYGAFVELEPGIEGLIHVSEMSWTKKNVHPGKIVSTSQEVEVVILEVDPAKRRVSLGLKQTMRNPWEEFAEKHPVGSVVEGEVKNKTEFGLFLGLENDVDGMVHLSDLDWNRSGEEAMEQYKKGEIVKAKVLDVDVEKERISLGIKQVGGDPMEAVERPEEGRHRHRRGDAGHRIRHRGEDRRQRHDRLHPPRRAFARALRAAARPLRSGREGRCPRHQHRQEEPEDIALHQGARNRRGEGGGRPVRLDRFRRLARRHPRRCAEEAADRRRQERGDGGGRKRGGIALSRLCQSVHGPRRCRGPFLFR